MNLRKKRMLTTVASLAMVLVAALSTPTIKAKRDNANDNLAKIIMQDGVICRINPSTGEATLLGVAEFNGNSFPDTICNNGHRYIINRIAPYCLWPSRQNAPDSITIPDGIRHIDERAFITMPYLRHVNLPEDLRTLGRQAFAFTDLRSIIFPQTLKEIGRGAFEGCRNLSEIDLSCVLYIDNEAFKDCAIRFLTIYTGHEVIGSDAFKDNNTFLLYLDEDSTPRAVIMGFESIFGTTKIPWIGIEMGNRPEILLKYTPKEMEGRVGIAFGEAEQYYENSITVPHYFGFKEDGSDEMKWRSDFSLWPLTDSVQNPSREDHHVLITPLRVRIDTSSLIEENINYKVLYNGEDVTSTMHGDTLILTEGKILHTTPNINSKSYNHIDVVRVKP